MSDPTPETAPADGTEPAESTQPAESTEPAESTAPVDGTEPDGAVTEPAEAVTEPTPARPRRRGLVAVLVVVGIVVVLGVAAVFAENVARAQAQALIAGEVRSALQLEADHPVDVAIAGPPVLWQAAGGRFERITVDVPELSIGDLRGDLTLIAEGTPLDTAQPTDSVQAVFEVQEADVAALAGLLSGAVATDVRLDDREIRFETGFDLFGVPFTIGIGLTPTVEEGQLAFTPSSVVLGDERLDAEQLQQQFGDIVAPLFASQRVCVAQYLPQALELTAVQVGDAQLLVVFQGADVALGGPEFSTLGTCS